LPTETERFVDAIPLSDDDLTDIAEALVLAVMRSASTDTIRAIDWWPRARSALQVAAAQAESWPHMISKMGQKLQIEAFQAMSSKTIAQIRVPNDAFPRFREICQRDSLFIVAMAQATRDRQKEEFGHEA